MRSFNILIALYIFSFSNAYSYKTPEFYKDISNQHSAEIEQYQLFNMIRKGVVTIKVNSYLVVDNSMRENLWYGTGFIVDIEKGLIVTNAHVAGEFAVCSYEVKFGNGTKAEAKLEYIDPAYDFGILSVKKSDIPAYCSALKISQKPIELNTTVYAMGNSLNNEFSTYKGYVFDKESILWLKPIAEQSFQFSGLTVPGASGSPVFNLDGEVIGLLYGGRVVSGAALPIGYVVSAVRAIQDERQFKRYFLGAIFEYLSLQDAVDLELLPKSAKEEYDKAFPNSSSKIVYVKKTVAAFSDKEENIKSGDIIWRVDGELIGPELMKIDQIVQEKDGKNVTVAVYRDGKEKEFEVQAKELSNKKKFKMLYFAGTTFFELNDDLKITKDQVNNGVFVADSETGSPFANIAQTVLNWLDDGFAPVNIIEIDSKKISTLDDLVSLIPDLLKKKIFKVKYRNLNGDSQECTSVMKYNPEFAEARLYTFKNDKKTWHIDQIKNPNRQ